MNAIGDEMYRHKADASIGLCTFVGLLAAHSGFDVNGISPTPQRTTSL